MFERVPWGQVVEVDGDEADNKAALQDIAAGKVCGLVEEGESIEVLRLPLEVLFSHRALFYVAACRGWFGAWLGCQCQVPTTAKASGIPMPSAAHPTRL